MRLFLSYASEDINLAEQLYLALTGAGHNVFFDRTDLTAGREYNYQIHQAIMNSDLFIFLISSSSVSESSYTLTELALAQSKWRHPSGFVLPVMARKTDYGAIPNYLKAITILEPHGNIAAEVTYEVVKIAEKKTHILGRLRRFLFEYWLSFAAILVIFMLLSIFSNDKIINRFKSENSVHSQLEELQKKLMLMELDSANIKKDYEVLKEKLSLISVRDKELVNTNLVRELDFAFRQLMMTRWKHKSNLYNLILHYQMRIRPLLYLRLVLKKLIEISNTNLT